MENASLSVAKIPRDIMSFLGCEDSALELAIDTHIAPKGTRVLRKHVDWATESGKRTAVDVVRVSGAINVWPHGVDGVMDHISRPVEQPVGSTVHDFALAVHEDKIRAPHEPESSAERVDPEMVRHNWVPERDVARDTLVETQLSK